MPFAGDSIPRGPNATSCAPPGCSQSEGQNFNRGQRAFFFALGYLGLVAAAVGAVRLDDRGRHRDVAAGQFASTGTARLMIELPAKMTDKPMAPEKSSELRPVSQYASSPSIRGRYIVRRKPGRHGVERNPRSAARWCGSRPIGLDANPACGMRRSTAAYDTRRDEQPPFRRFRHHSRRENAAFSAVVRDWSSSMSRLCRHAEALE